MSKEGGGSYEPNEPPLATGLGNKVGSLVITLRLGHWQVHTLTMILLAGWQVALLVSDCVE